MFRKKLIKKQRYEKDHIFTKRHKANQDLRH